MKGSKDTITPVMFKLENINRQLGGQNKKKEETKKKPDEFIRIKTQVLKGLHEISKNQEARDEQIEKFGPSLETVKMSAITRELLNKVADDILAMGEALRRQRKNPKKYTQFDLANKGKQHLNCIEQLKELQNYEKGGCAPEEKVITYTDMKAELLKGGRTKNYGSENRELTEQEGKAVDQMKQRDQQLDEKIVLINEKLLGLIDKTEEMSGAVANREELVINIHNEVGKGVEMMKKDNGRLKKLVAKDSLV